MLTRVMCIDGQHILLQLVNESECTPSTTTSDLNGNLTGDLNFHVANSQSGNNFVNRVSTDFDLTDIKSNLQSHSSPCSAFCFDRFGYCHLPFQIAISRDKIC